MFAAPGSWAGSRNFYAPRGPNPLTEARNAPIALVVWLFIIPFALSMLALEELRKWLLRSRPKRPATGLIQDPF